MPSLHADLTTRFASISDTPDLDASVLIAHILHKPRTWVMAHPELSLTSEQQKQLDDSLARFENGEPFPYILGYWEFFGLDFEVTRDVLIPRPETELLVERAIAWLQESPDRKRVADIGTGSGVIAVSIAVNVPNARLLATDISHAALEVAHRNATKLNVANRIEFVHCDILPQRPKQFDIGNQVDLICANLPYIPTDTLQRLPIYKREPTLALDGGADGLELFRRLMKIASNWLAPHGLMLLEIEATQGSHALKLAHKTFARARIQLYPDLTGRDRLLEIQT